MTQCFAGHQAHTQGGGGGKLRSLAWEGVSRPTPGGKLRGLAWVGGLQAHTRGEVEGSGLGVSKPTSGGVSRPTPEGSSGPHPGGSPGPHLGGIPTCTEADTPQQMATAVGGTHPTGMHSCNVLYELTLKKLKTVEHLLTLSHGGFHFLVRCKFILYKLIISAQRINTTSVLKSNII